MKRDNKKQELVLVHGWDPKIYTHLLEKTSESVAWNRRKDLIAHLNKRFKLSYFNLPGFAGKGAPSKDKFDLDDYADNFYDYIKTNKKEEALFLGYSFGGAVVLHAKSKFDLSNKIILISPAIKRWESKKSSLGRIGRQWVPAFLHQSVKHWYQFIFSKYYRLGTAFLRRSYDLIVRVDLRLELTKMKASEVLLIYGDHDSSTPYGLVKKVVLRTKMKYGLIKGGHNIGETAPEEIIKVIDNWINK